MKIQKIRGSANQLCDPRRSVQPPQMNRPSPSVESLGWLCETHLKPGSLCAPTYRKRCCSFSWKSKNSSTPENITVSGK